MVVKRVYCARPICIGPEVVGEHIKGSLRLQRVMWALGIEPSEAAQQALVELRQVVEQQLLVDIMELVLHGAIQCAFIFGVRGKMCWCTTPEALRALSKCRANS